MQLDFSFLSAKARSLIGMDISSSAVKMVELAMDAKGGYRVERYVIEPLPRDAVADGNIANLEGVADTIKRGWRKLATSTKHVALALPVSHVITKKIIVPGGQREDELEMFVESEANQYIPFPMEDVELDFQILGSAPSSPDELEVLIAASKKEKVEDRVAAVEAAGLKADIVDVDAFAMSAAFELVQRQLPQMAEGKIIALIDIGASLLGLTVVKDGQQLYSREQAFGGAMLTQEIARVFGMSFDEAELEKRRNNLPENYDAHVLEPFVANLSLEVSRALQFFFTSTQFSQVDHIVLAGGCSVLPRCDEVIAARTQVDVIVANPFGEMTLSDRVRARSLLIDAPSLMVACGLALRRFDQ